MQQEPGDLRPYLEKFQDMGQLRVVEGADWDLEIGTITELSCAESVPPALLFDSVKGYPKGFRVLSNIYNTQRRTAVCFGLPENLQGVALVDAYRKKIRSIKHIKPVEVSDGPIFENVLMNDNVNMLKFPTPKWHKDDGGRYIGTADAIIMKDPDEGWVNLGNYRVMIHDERNAAIWISPGHHGRIIREKYWSKGKNCPVVVACGIDPPLFSATTSPLDWGVSEYDFAGGWIGAPYKTVSGKVTGLPIPAYAEIAFEGEIPPPSVDSRAEGPFGEWTGHYASGSRDEPVVHVKAIYHRNDPVITAYLHPGRSYYNGYNIQVVFASHVWDALERAKVPQVKGVWIPEATHQYMIVISIKQMYSGHAKQAAFAALGAPPAGYHGRFVVVVDDDINPASLKDVLWAMGTRCDPESQIDIVRGCWSTLLDTVMEPKKKAERDLTNSRAIINACKPFYWINEFPKNTRPDPEYSRQVAEKWKLPLDIGY